MSLGDRGPERPASCALYSRFPPRLQWFPPLCAFPISNYCALFQNFSYFSLLPPPWLSASRVLFSHLPLFPGSQPPCLPQPPYRDVMILYLSSPGWLGEDAFVGLCPHMLLEWLYCMKSEGFLYDNQHLLGFSPM